MKNLNSTFLVFIPKIQVAPNIINVRPISLVGAVCKLVAKILARTRKRQHAFVLEGRGKTNS